MARHFCALRLSSIPYALTWKTSLAPPLQVHSCTGAPSWVELPVTLRHFPWMRSVPSRPSVKRWAAVPLHA